MGNQLPWQNGYKRPSLKAYTLNPPTFNQNPQPCAIQLENQRSRAKLRFLVLQIVILLAPPVQGVEFRGVKVETLSFTC